MAQELIQSEQIEATLSGKTINLTSNTLTGTTAQFNTANSDADFYTTGGTDVSVADGGTGRSTSTTAYGLIAAGTTATGPHQTLAAGATTEILVGGGASALPVWTTATGSGAPVRSTSPTITTPTIEQINNSSAPGVKLQVRTQTDNNNSISSATTAGVFVQYGWGQVEGAGATTVSATVTFPTAFTTVLGVMVSTGAAKATTAATSITDLQLEYANATGVNTQWSDVTTSTFLVTIGRSTGNFNAGTFYGYSWIAWGV